MQRKWLNVLLAMTLTVGILSGCQKAEKQEPDVQSVEEVQPEEGQTDPVGEEQPQESEGNQAKESDAVTVRIAALKGPTTMGLVKLWQDQDEGTAKGNYEFQMLTGADEIMPRLIKGDVDIALLPANAAAVLYQKSEGAIEVIDINTLGVLYLVSGQDSVISVDDLKGKTIYLTGKGTTPDYVLQYLLAQHNISADEVNLEYKSEAAEVAVLLKENPDSIGLLPQPFVTAACAQNETLSVVMDLNVEWENLNEGKGIVTGVTVVRKGFLEEHPEAVALFMEEHRASAEFAGTNTEETAELVVARGIIEKAPVAAKALPACHITYIDGTEMKEALSDYLAVLFGQNPESVGGAMPEDDFYMAD